MEDLDLILKDLNQKSQVAKVKKSTARPVSSVMASSTLGGDNDLDDLDNLMKNLATNTKRSSPQQPNKPATAPPPPPTQSISPPSSPPMIPPSFAPPSAPMTSVQAPIIPGSTTSPPIGGRERRNTHTEELDSIITMNNNKFASAAPISTPTFAVTGALAPTAPDPVDKKPPKVTLATPGTITGGTKAPTSRTGGKAENELDNILNNITQEMESLGVNSETSKVCGGCGKVIIGPCMKALGKQFHLEHFTCTHCKVQLGTLPYFEKDGYPYCEDHYHLLFSPRCAYCDKPISDRCLTALGHMWHPEHFLCAICEKPLTEASTYYEKEGKAYCEQDFYKAYAPKCRSCNQSIVGDTINAIGTTWHPEHFVCQTCKQPFGPKGFFEVEGLPYCDKHYVDIQGQSCGGCSKPIAGKAVNALGKKYHPEHFVCAYCMKKLDENSFSAQGNKPYCKTCHSKLFS